MIGIIIAGTPVKLNANIYVMRYNKNDEGDNMFSNCFNKCDTCYIHFVGGCLAGNGDDDYIEITLERATEALKKRWIKDFYKKDLFKLFPELEKLNFA